MALTTLPDLSQGQVTTEAYFDNLNIDVNELIGLRSRNLLTNGGFEVWQRGAGPFSALNAYSADRWLIGSSGVGTITKETTTVDSSGSSLKAVVTANGFIISQKLEDFAQLRGQTLSLSVRIQQSVASGVTMSIQDGIGTPSFPTSSTTGAWVTLTQTFVVAASATSVTIAFQFSVGTHYLDNAMLVMGPAPTAYVPLHPQEELARCQRYYEVHGGVNNGSPSPLGFATAAGQYVSCYVPFAVQKGGLPTVTKLGTWGVTNCGQPTVGQVTPNGYLLLVTSSAAGNPTTAFPNSSDDLIVAEFNP